ncbi:Sir2 family NAD+-dependent deacetylase [Thalassolituus pacificus]|uniref:NAD-dependent protein deacylase n=1 Tax=Thalassolituus pacificus TaxID=2975440 RepID=A0A9X2WIJ4_9GAMM|nr:Sir2 family NAD+-dependent deacetylase [Thalassolituus pacificus]MCT7361072.1 NAD-dependent protein deacylase [Thalassolituus pacificus]
MKISAYQRIVVLTGAGISAESGIRTFRDAGGLWENHRLEDVATPEAFVRDPQLVQRFYNDRRRQLKDVSPNPAHLALAAFEQQFSGDFLLVTQNVDDLHDRAGSRNLLHMHGELNKARCLLSGNITEHQGDISADVLCPCCQRPSLRPHIVWFGEMPLYMDEICATLEQCDLFLSIGTSGHVYPAAGFVEVARQASAHTVEINLEPSNTEDAFAEHLYGQASQTLPRFLQQLL